MASSFKVFQNKFLFKNSLSIETKYEYDKYSEEALEILAQLIDNLAQTSIFVFIAKIPEILRLSKKINGLHPFNTLEFIYEKAKEKILLIYNEKHCMTSYKNLYGWAFAQIRNNFTEGLCHFLQIRHDENKLKPHLESFCERTNFPKDVLEDLISKENWQGFITHFVDTLKPDS